LVLVELATAALETAAARLSAWDRSLRHQSASSGATSMQGLEGDYENRDWDVNNDVPMAQKAHHQQPITDLRQVDLVPFGVVDLSLIANLDKFNIG
jgi:hypothetical protein